jgi:YjbR protein
MVRPVHTKLDFASILVIAKAALPRPACRAGARLVLLLSRLPHPRAVSLRGRYTGITPGYHLSKRHWNTVTLDGSVPDEEVLELVHHSYDLVVARLTKAQRAQLTGP